MRRKYYLICYTFFRFSCCCAVLFPELCFSQLLATGKTEKHSGPTRTFGSQTAKIGTDTAKIGSHKTTISSYNPVWDSQSSSAAESMPCGGGDVGLNVWVENGELLFYVSRSGTFDENNTLLKLGRVRVKLYPNPFEQLKPANLKENLNPGGSGKSIDNSKNTTFRQELDLEKGLIKINGLKNGLAVEIIVRVDVFNPVVHVAINSNKAVEAEFAFESWRNADRVPKGKENNANSWKWAPKGEVKTFKDVVSFEDNSILFYHRNKENTVFDAVVQQQGLEEMKDKMDNPLRNLTFGGMLIGKNLRPAGTSAGRYLNTDFEAWKLKSIHPAKKHALQLVLYTSQEGGLDSWYTHLISGVTKARRTPDALVKSLNWWKAYWERSFIMIDNQKGSEEWQAARNYQLFRYMLGCNAFGSSPTKFNGGLFTYDPALTDTTLAFTPDFRNWGGGTHTAQNQRLVYWPMLKSGDAEMMVPQFDFYNRALKNAEIRSAVYWKHKGAAFSEQLENFGLPNPAEYGWKRPAGYDKGMEYNAWLEYEWDTVLEFCLMILEQERYTGKDITQYVPLIESSLTFFNEHYQYLAKQRGSKSLDGNGRLVLYPGSGAETYKMAYNSSSTIAGLKTVLRRVLELPPAYLDPQKRKDWQLMLDRIPEISFREFNGKTTIAPAKIWQRINNTESPQLYPVFPWGIYGLGKPGLDTALNTYRYDTDVIKFRSHIGWKQDNIFAARLGLTTEAARLTLLKLKDSGRRFTAFWGPGFDWVPDHNWGGSGMIGLQEMLMQTDGTKILLFPAWPASWNTHFKLHAPYQTIVEGVLKDGKVTSLKVSPESRRKDVVVMLR